MPARCVTSVSALASESALGIGPASGRTGGLERTLAGFATWVGLAAFSKKLPEWGKKSLTTGYALMSIFLAVLVCIFTGPF